MNDVTNSKEPSANDDDEKADHDNDAIRAAAAYLRYTTAMHAMQSACAFLEESGDGKEFEPKHLRVGVNSALQANGALVKLLIAKGVFSEADYAESIADYAEADQATYEREASAIVGRKVSFA